MGTYLCKGRYTEMSSNITQITDRPAPEQEEVDHDDPALEIALEMFEVFNPHSNNPDFYPGRNN